MQDPYEVSDITFYVSCSYKKFFRIVKNVQTILFLPLFSCDLSGYLSFCVLLSFCSSFPHFIPQLFVFLPPPDTSFLYASGQGSRKNRWRIISRKVKCGRRCGSQDINRDILLSSSGIFCLHFILPPSFKLFSLLLTRCFILPVSSLLKERKNKKRRSRNQIPCILVSHYFPLYLSNWKNSCIFSHTLFLLATIILPTSST